MEHFCYWARCFRCSGSLFEGIFISPAYWKALLSVQSSLSDPAVVQFEMFLKERYHFIKIFS